jgi:uncharacterized circularly permuted ATP-grasp superfamily protein/uncharacterized alpha-E superfamily protein
MSTTSPSADPRPDADRSLGYAPTEDVWDEMLVAPGQPRPHWTPVVRWLRGQGRTEMARRWEQGRRLIHENGVTYNVYGDPRGMHRPWELDAVPLVVSPGEWSKLDHALAQRAHVLNLVLADLYGAQRLVRDGLLPPELVYANPAFLRPCHGVAFPGDIALHVYAADLARAADGCFWVIADRTQAPSGAGYALENRIVVSRTLPEIFRECRVQRLAAFFGTLRDTLRGLALRHRENPRIVLLTPGPYNETYFEHAYLARYLGFTLVEGADLTVRDSVVYLKTLGGLEPVDVILRRLDDAFCDPLSLRSDSSLGIAGLLQAVRANNVVVGNGLGSGVVETAALMAFLPSLCKHLLDEELAMPSVATWWCGHADALDYVVEHLESLVIKPAFPIFGHEPIFGSALSARAREDLLARVRARPHEYVAQEQVTLSTAPIWTQNGLQPRHVVLRTFGVASGDGYRIMPGGLARVATSRESLVVSMQRGGGSKDTWVGSDGPVSAMTLLRPAGAPMELTRGGSELPSRVADNLFWLGRYVERAEGTVRLLRSVLSRLADEASGSVVPELPILLSALAAHAGLEDDLVSPDLEIEPAARERGVLDFLRAHAPARALRPTIGSAQRLASISRDQISLDTWRVLNQLEDYLPPRDAVRALTVGDAIERMNQLVLAMAAFNGLSLENMTRGQGWRFTDIGRRLERSLFLLTLFQHTMVTPCRDETRTEETRLLEALLETADSAITYRRRYLGTVQPAPVLDLLVTDETNPRALVYQVRALAEHVERLPRAGGEALRTAEERTAIAALAQLRMAVPEELAGVGLHGERVQLADLLGQLGEELMVLSDTVTQSYLSHAATTRPLSGYGSGGPW